MVRVSIAPETLITGVQGVVTGGDSMDYHEERMLRLLEGLPQNDSDGYNAVVPVVDFEFSQTGDPVKDRRKNIKRAIKALSPVKRWFSLPLIGSRWRYVDGHRCVIDGANCEKLTYGVLFDKYFKDRGTGQLRAFRPWSGVLPGKGSQMSGTYCPQHMQLYDHLAEWLEQEAAESDHGFFKSMKKKGVTFVPVKQTLKSKGTPMYEKWNEAFIEAKKDGIPITYFRDPTTNEVVLTVLSFHSSILKEKFTHGNTISGSEYTNESKAED